MTRFAFTKAIVADLFVAITALPFALTSCSRPDTPAPQVDLYLWEPAKRQWQRIRRPLLQLPANEWRSRLGEMGFFVLRQRGTEPPFNNRFHQAAPRLAGGPGLYRCRGCQNHLFFAKDQFVSPTGWPSFLRPAHAANVALLPESGPEQESRLEVRCNGCNGHLGHRFDDGLPPDLPPGEPAHRYCLNSAALEF